MGLGTSQMENKTGVINFVFFAVLFCGGCLNSPQNDYTAVDEEIQVQKAIGKFTLVETQGKNKKWVMDADSAEFIETEQGEVIRVENLTVKFFESKNSQTIMKAQRGDYNRKSQVLITKGKVEIKTAEKKIITSDIKWDPQKEKFITQENVVIFTEDGIIKGKGMEASRDLKEIKIKNKITGELRE